MKITRLILCAIICIFLTTPILAAEYSYSGANTGEKAAKNEWDKLITSLPSEVQNEVDDIDPYSPENAISSVREKSSVGYWINRGWDAINDAFFGVLPMILPIFLMLYESIASM